MHMKKLLAIVLTATLLLGWTAGHIPLVFGAAPVGFVPTYPGDTNQEQESATVTAITSPPQFTSKVKAYKRANEDTVGWLYIPGTTINNVVVQNPNALGNNYYLRHSFTGQLSVKGTYCADRRDHFGTGSRESLSRNTVLYAHNFDDDPNGILFAQLQKYKDPDFAARHPYIFFSTESEDLVWEVFAVYDTTVNFPYVWPNLSYDTYRYILHYVDAASIYQYNDISITENDKLLTLSTCTFSIKGKKLEPGKENDYRFVVMARLVNPGESLHKNASLTVRQKTLHADNMPTLENQIIAEVGDAYGTDDLSNEEHENPDTSQ